jgi:hypothetical protein
LLTCLLDWYFCRKEARYIAYHLNSTLTVSYLVTWSLTTQVILVVQIYTYIGNAKITKVTSDRVITTQKGREKWQLQL